VRIQLQNSKKSRLSSVKFGQIWTYIDNLLYDIWIHLFFALPVSIKMLIIIFLFLFYDVSLYIVSL
jgi:hypothetical protein